MLCYNISVLTLANFTVNPPNIYSKFSLKLQNVGYF